MSDLTIVINTTDSSPLAGSFYYFDWRVFDLVIFGSRWVDLHYVNDVSTLYDDWKQKFLLNFNVKTTCGFFGLLLTPTPAGDQLDVVNLIY